MSKFTSNNSHYIQYFTYNDEIKELKLDTRRVYEKEIWEDIMNYTIYTPEEQQENFNKAMSRLDAAQSYDQLAQVAKDIKAASDSAKSNGDFVFPYNEETKKNMISEFWEKYFQLKQVYVDSAVKEIKSLIAEHDRITMLKKIKRAIYAVKVLDRDSSAPLYELCDKKIAQIQEAA